MFVSWRGDLLRSSTARVFFSKFIEDVCVCVCVYIGRASSRISSWLSSSSSFRANTAKKEKEKCWAAAAAAAASRRPLLLPLSLFLLAALLPAMGGALTCSASTL